MLGLSVELFSSKKEWIKKNNNAWLYGGRAEI